MQLEEKLLKLVITIRNKIDTIRAYILLQAMKILEKRLERLRLSSSLRKASAVLTEREIGAILAAQLLATVRNNEHSYVSSVGAQYSHLTETGKRIMAELTEMMFTKAVELDKKRRQNDAEQLVMDNLKK
jgi:hypothetical protein